MARPRVRRTAAEALARLPLPHARAAWRLPLAGDLWRAFLFSAFHSRHHHDIEDPVSVPAPQPAHAPAFNPTAQFHRSTLDLTSSRTFFGILCIWWWPIRAIRKECFYRRSLSGWPTARAVAANSVNTPVFCGSLFRVPTVVPRRLTTEAMSVFTVHRARSARACTI